MILTDQENHLQSQNKFSILLVKNQNKNLCEFACRQHIDLPQTWEFFMEQSVFPSYYCHPVKPHGYCKVSLFPETLKIHVKRLTVLTTHQNGIFKMLTWFCSTVMKLKNNIY